MALTRTDRVRRLLTLLLASAVAFFLPTASTSAQDVAWESTSGMYGGTVLAIDEIAGVLYAGTTRGLFRSVDAGQTWSYAGLMASVRGVAEVDGRIVAVGGRDVFASDDGGETWAGIGRTTGSSLVTSLAVTSEGAILVGTGGALEIGAGIMQESGLYRSADAGETWNEVTGSTRYNVVWDVVADTAEALYAVTIDHLLRSTDGGDSWETVGPSGYAVYSNGAGTLLVAREREIRRSTDFGVTWSTVAENIHYFPSALEETSDGSLFLAAFSPRGVGKIYKSDDSGASWSVAAELSIPVLDLHANASGLLAGTEFRGVFRSQDGDAWSSSNEGLSALHVPVLGAASVDTVFAGTRYLYHCCDGYGGSDGTVYRSLDGGLSWRPTELEGTGITNFAFGPGKTVLAASLDGLHRSDDGGSHWEAVPTDGLVGAFHAVHLADDGSILLSLASRGIVLAHGTYRSQDGGTTWNQVSQATAHAFVTAGGSVYAPLSDGVVRLDDGSVPVLDRKVEFLETSADGTLYALGDSLYRSSDGAAWTGEALPATSAHTLTVNGSGQVIISSTDGLFISKTEGETWTRIGAGANAIAALADDHLLATFRRGVDRSMEPVVLGAESAQPGQPAGASLLPGYPNPTSGLTTIPFEIERSSHVRISVFDLVGRRRATLVDRVVAAGWHDVRWDAAALPPGAYVVRLQAGGFSATRIVVALPH